jgi:hypothetical protein
MGSKGLLVALLVHLLLCVIVPPSVVIHWSTVGLGCHAPALRL